MRKKSTRLLSAALAVCMMLSVLPVGAFAAVPGAEEQENDVSAQAEEEFVQPESVEINSTNFQDTDFRDYVKKFDINNDDKLSLEERNKVTTIELPDDSYCPTIKGIEYFPELVTLKCPSAHVRSLDVSKNLKLETLWCYWNSLRQLDVSKNKALKDLRCGHNYLTTLNVSQNETLECLSTNEMQSKLNSLDVSYNKALKHLECTKNGLTSLDVSSNEALERLVCDKNPLTELDVSKNNKLISLDCKGCGLTSLKFGSAVSSMDCSENLLTELDVSQNTGWSYLRCNGNKLTSLSFNENAVMAPNHDIYTSNNHYQIAVDADGIYDLSQLPGDFDVSKTSDWTSVERNRTILKVTPGSTTVTYKYNTGSTYTGLRTFNLDVHWHKYQWQHNGTKHWRECTTANCPGLTAEQVAVAPHVYDNAKDNDCNTCGYVRPLYTVTTVNATAKLKSEAEELNAPVAAGTEVTLTAGNAPEGKTFAGWKLYKVVNDTESEITNDTELSELLKNGTETTATLTMPAYNVKAEPYYSDIPYNITPVDCTVDKTEAAKGETVTATRREPEANEHFIDWTVKVNGVKQPDDFLTPDENDPAKVRFVMPAENVEIKANFEGNPTLNIGDHVTANIDGSDTPVPSGSTVPVGETVHLTATAPDGQHFISWTVLVGGEEKEAGDFLKQDADDPTKVTFTMPDKNVEVKANFASNPTLNPTLRVGDHVTATIEGSDASVPSGSTVPVPKNKIVHLTATAPGQHFISWTVKVNGVEQDPTFLKPDADDPTKVTFIMPDANVEVTATFADDPIPEPDPVGPSDTGNIQGAVSAVVIGAAAGAIIYEAGTGIYRVINMPGIPMPSNRIELAELLWEHAGKPEPVSTALYSDIDEGDTDAQKAARWAVEQDLMKDDADNNKFHPAFPVSKLRTCLTWNAAKEKGLFDKTEE
jgi:hypothetical protein